MLHPTDTSPLFKALFENSAVNAILRMDTGGYIHSCNLCFRTYFGYNDDDVSGRHFSMLFTEEDRASGKPAIELQNVLLKGQADDKNYLVHKNKTVTWVSGESILVHHPDGSRSLIKIFQDIGKQKESELSLHRANEFNESILRGIEDFVLVVDPSMRIIKYNPAFGRLFKEGDPVIIDFPSFIAAADTDQRVQADITSMLATGAAVKKYELQLPAAGVEKTFELSFQQLFAGDEQRLVAVIGHDISAQRRSDREREDLIGFVAHELRNPLATMMLSNDLLRMMVEQKSLDGMGVFLEKNKSNLLRLTKMVEELYDAAKVDGGNFELSLATFSLDEMISESLAAFRLLHPGLPVIVNDLPELPVLGDRYRLVQVLNNYLGNAVKYGAGEKGITIKVEKSPQKVTVAVQDQGNGIPPDQLPHIFERYYRADQTKKMDGIGMGLYLCSRIIKAHGGRVWAESTPGEGSIFYFSIPS